MPQISYFTNLADKSPRSITLDQLHQLLTMNKALGKTISKIRAATDKEQLEKLKRGLPAVTLSGVFKGGHQAKQLVERSDFMQIDFDGVDVAHVRQQLVNDPYTVLAFISPSGKGVKGVVRYEGDHLQAFNNLSQYYAEKYGLNMDKSCKDICRLCFLSHDPQTFYHLEAPVFGALIAPKEPPQPTPPPQHNGDKNNHEKVQNICANIAARGVDITGTYEDWLKCGLALANEFNEDGRAYFHAVSKNNSGYKPDETDRKYNDALKGQSTVTIAYFFARAQSFGLMEKSQARYQPVYIAPAAPVKEYTPAELKELHSFYKPKFNKYGELEGIKFNRQRFLNILAKLGISVFRIDANTFKFVRVEENRLEEVSTDLLPSIFQRYIFSLPPVEVDCKQYDSEGNATDTKMQLRPSFINEQFLANLENLFNKKLLMLLTPAQDYQMFEDTKHEKFFFYRNGVACITKDKITFKPYGEFDKHIWKNQLLQRDYKEPGDDTSAVFEEYVNRLALVREPDGKGGYIHNQEATLERFKSLCSIIGYNLHSFFATKLFATNLTDSRMDENGEANGRSGKTLLVRGLGRMLNADKASSVYVELGGKTFDVRDKHRYENCSIDTRLVHLNDVPRYFKIEPLFNDITDGMRAKKLYEGTFTILTKMIISSNKSLWIDGDSAKDRVLVFEVSDYFSAKHSPEHEFKHWFFDDWDSAEWARFDAFMMRCVQLYLREGVLRAASINIEKRMLRDHTHHDFVRWLDYRFAEYDDDKEYNENRIKFCYEGDNPATVRYEKRTLFEAFRTDYPDFLNAKFTQAKFTSWLKIYIDKTFADVKLVEQRSNGKDYVYFLRSR